MSKPKTRKMVALKVLETSGVDHPAHLEEGWIVMKSAQGDSVSEESVGMAEGLEEAYIERVVELEKALAEAQTRNALLEDRIAKGVGKKGDEDEEDEELMKSVPAPVREMLAKAREEADAVREELRKEREERRDAEFVEKVAGWSHLSLDAEAVGPALRRLSDTDASLAEAFEKAFEAVNAQAESADIFEELGRTTRPSDSSALSKVQSLAKAAHDRGEYSTIEQATSAMIASNPDLYAAYRAETL